ncbi:MAG: hypothetical protein ACI3ZN_01745 [Candidatus Cryptobacteroides sp.]
MNKIFKYILAAAAVSFAATACVEEETHPYGESDLEGCYGVYFPAQEASGAHTYDPSMPTEVVVKAVRRNSKGTITVPVTSKASEEGIFNVESLVFDDGQSEAEFKITFPNSQNGITYSISLAIEDPLYASRYKEGAVNFDFSVLRVEWKDLLNPVTNEPAIVTFNQSWWGEVHTATVKYYEVNGLRTCVATCNETDEEGNPTGIWGDAIGVQFNFTWDTNTVNADGYQVLDVPRQYFGFDYGSSWASIPEKDAVAPIYFYDWFHYLTTDGGYAGAWDSWSQFLQRNPGAYDQSYYDGNGGFYFNLRYYVPAAGGGFGAPVFDVLAVVDGYTRVDYSLDVETDYPQEGIAPLYFESGVDVAAIKFVAVEGKLVANQIEAQASAIADGSAKDVMSITEFEYDEESGKNVSATGLSFPATGVYTVVAGAFDANGQMQSSTSVYIDYVAADDDTYEVILSAGVEDTPARYESAGYNIYNSLAYYVVGSNLTDVKVGLYKTSSAEKYGLDYLVSDLRSSSKSSVSEEVLAQINGVGGYASVMANLSEATSYTFVVWATNGKQDKYLAYEYSTEKYPEVWKSLGTGSYTDDIIGPVFGADPITYEVEIEESEETPGKYRLVNPYCEAFPYNEEGDWDASQDWPLIIYCDNPDQVYIPMQYTGCDWGYGNMTIVSYAYYMIQYNGATADQVADTFGSLKDGVITFPTKAILAGFGGKLYYGNTNGAFKVVLPSAYSKSVAAMAPAKVTRQQFVPVSAAVKAFTLPCGVRSDISYVREYETVEAKMSSISPVTRSNASSRTVLTKERIDLK